MLAVLCPNGLRNKIFPLTEKENSQGFYYLDAAYKSIQHYEEMKALCEKLDEEYEIAEERLEKCEEEIIGKIDKQLDLFQKRLGDEFKDILSTLMLIEATWPLVECAIKFGEVIKGGRAQIVHREGKKKGVKVS